MLSQVASCCWRRALSSVGGQQQQRRYMSVERNNDYATLDEKDIVYFERHLGAKNVLREDLDAFNIDWMKWFKGQSKCVLTPESAEQISAVLRHCYERRIAIVPQAGNTGMTGASTPVHDELIISTKKLNKFLKLDLEAGIVECDAGFVLEQVDQKLAPDNFMLPIDLGARGSCCIGGVISTNAGGIRLVRYGSLSANVLALQVVIPDEKGTILSLGSKLRKDSSNVKLHQLFVGAEGQFGIITRASILTPPKPASVQLAVLGTNTFENCTTILRAAKQHLGEILSSFELMDNETMRCIKENVELDNVLKSDPKFNLIIESSGSSAAHDSEKMSNFIELCLDKNYANDGIMCESGTDSAYVWKLRENASLALNLEGYVYKQDLTLPQKHFYALTEATRERLRGTNYRRLTTFGHLGDGNTHINVSSERYEQEIYDCLYPWLYEWVIERGGSMSAEHGIGRLKRVYHHALVDPNLQRLNSQMKRVFDPRALLSPYKMVD